MDKLRALACVLDSLREILVSRRETGAEVAQVLDHLVYRLDEEERLLGTEEYLRAASQAAYRGRCLTAADDLEIASRVLRAYAEERRRTTRR